MWVLIHIFSAWSRRRSRKRKVSKRDIRAKERKEKKGGREKEEKKKNNKTMIGNIIVCIIEKLVINKYNKQ